MTGVLLAEGVRDLVQENKSFTRENLEATYLRRRRKSWVEKEARVAKHARDGFRHGLIRGMLGMGLAGFTGGRLFFHGPPKRPYERVPTLEEYYHGRLTPEELKAIREKARREQTPLFNLIMDKLGWPAIPYDGKLLLSHQDALLVGGKVQAPEGHADHVVFLYPQLCEKCDNKMCIEICSAQAITPGETGGVPAFDREKCIHCGACWWSCSRPRPENPELTNIDFRAGAGGLHSSEN